MDTVESTSLGPGLVAFLIVVALALATVGLWYSMVKQIRKVPPTFDEPDTTDHAAGTQPQVGEPAVDDEGQDPPAPAS